LAAAFGPGSRAEVPLAGVVGDQVIAGQVDRLVVGEDEVLVIDYKTERAPPATPERVPAAYLRQMAAYAALLRQIYPERRVRCALLWTQGPRLMPLDEAALASHALQTWQPRAGGAAEG
ncbi:MAG TPA: PD-(D/E)XK nuclease family protein, partial [Geminicoccaceae bacterium]|nr:PD-(D/E)XK nuclease family protein [Geminicoccaceae bacterium]